MSKNASEKVSENNECLFCKIASGEIPSAVLYDDENVLAFLDIMPAASGHALVIPKEHFATLLDLPHDMLKDLTLTIQKVSAAVVKHTGASGFNVLQSNHESAGQVIPHVHFHIIPRFENDDLNFNWVQKTQDTAELNAYANEIKESLK